MRRIVESKYFSILCIIGMIVVMYISFIQWASSDDPIYPPKGDTYVTPEEAAQIAERMYPGNDAEMYEHIKQMCEMDQCYIDEHGELQLESERDK